MSKVESNKFEIIRKISVFAIFLDSINYEKWKMLTKHIFEQTYFVKLQAGNKIISTNVFKSGSVQEEIFLSSVVETVSHQSNRLTSSVSCNFGLAYGPFHRSCLSFKWETGPKHQEVDQPGRLTRAAQHAKVECSARLMSNRFS